MAFVFDRSLVIPLWVLAFCAVVISAPMRLMPSLLMLVGIAIMASTMQAIVRWWRVSRSVVELLPAREQVSRPPRTQESDDAMDLVRMDDDGGWHIAHGPNR